MIDKKTVSQCISSDYCRGWNDAVDAMPRWISVEERLPENALPHEHCMYNAVLLYTPVDGYIHIGWYRGKDYRGRNRWNTLSAMRSYQTMTKKVTHWMPLPELPKEE